MRSEGVGRRQTRDYLPSLRHRSFRAYRTSGWGGAMILLVPNGGQRMSNTPEKGDDPRSLPVLRALIDTIDHDVLQLLSRRNGLVAEVAAYKRRHGVAIRDARREREIIADRRERSALLGLSPEVIESIFRLVLWASRDRQASLRAQVPMNIEPRTIAIIGGRGGMGRCMGNLFADLGHAVMVSDVDTRLTPEEAASTADV